MNARLSLIIAAVGASFAGSPAFADGPTCGVDCNAGTYTACNDSFDETMPGTPVNCSASLGSCASEAFCASFGDNFQAAAFPLTVRRIYLVAASNNAMDAAMQFDLEIYQELGTPNPGPQIGNTLNLSIAGNQSAMTVIDFAGLGQPAPTLSTPGRFRVCLRKQFDQGHNICLDDLNAASMPGRNWAFVRIAADPNDPCGTILIPAAWYDADNPGLGFPGIKGDFILRPEIIPSAITGVPDGNMCGQPQDGGIPEGPVVIDSGPGDTGAGDGAAGDSGPAPDGDVDTGVADTGQAPPQDSGVPNADPPEIEAISPSSGPLGQQVAVTVTGRNFQTGLTLKIGQISAVGLELSGSTTLNADVPMGVAVGTYDVIVTNPDGQAAVLLNGFTVLGETSRPADSSCGCATTPRQESRGPLALLMMIGLLWVARRQRR